MPVLKNFFVLQIGKNSFMNFLCSSLVFSEILLQFHVFVKNYYINAINRTLLLTPSLCYTYFSKINYSGDTKK